MITFSGVNFNYFSKFASTKLAKNGVYGNSNQNQNIYIYDKNISFSGNNLAPLNADTVSFSGRDGVLKNRCQLEHLYEVAWNNGDIAAFNELKNLSASDEADKKMTSASYSLYHDMMPIAKELHNRAKNLENAFNVKMWMFDGLLIGDSKKSPAIQPVIVSKETRIKSPQSIAKKLAAKVSKTPGYDSSYRPLMDTELAKDEIHDVFGARLVLRTGTEKETNKIINRIIDSYKVGDSYRYENGLKIKTIKNYGITDKKYVTNKKLYELIHAIDLAGGERPEVKTEMKNSGYTATHIIFEVGSGIDGEIQILGRGVLRVKNVEDVCYKGLQGKALEGMPEIAKALKKIGKDPELTNEFKAYLRSAYHLAKTKWDKMPDDILEAQRFPKIPEKFPSCLDLNNIEEAIIDAKENPKPKKKPGRHK